MTYDAADLTWGAERFVPIAVDFYIEVDGMTRFISTTIYPDGISGTFTIVTETQPTLYDWTQEKDTNG